MKVPGMERRDFIKAGTAAAASLVLVKPGSVYGAAANDAISLGIIGCGGRGNGVGKEFIGNGARVVALHDLFDDRLSATKESFDKIQAEKGFGPIDPKMLFKGPEAYHDLLAAPIDAVLITSPPYFHPDHFEAAVAAGRHTYLEKPVSTDVFGAQRVEKTAKKGAGKVSMTVGLQIRHSPAYQEMVRRIRAGDIGDIVCAQTFYYTEDLKRKATPDMSPLEARVRNWVFDRVLSGDILVEQNIHVIDVVNWVMSGHPSAVVGTGGKKARLDVDCWDHFTTSLTYPGNVHVSFNSTQFKGSYDSKAQRFMGTKGYAEAHYSKGGVRIVGENPWDANDTEPLKDAVKIKTAAFLDSIRNKAYLDEVAMGVESTLSAILARTAAYEGEERTWDKVAESNARWKERVDLSPLAPRRA